MPCHAHAWCCDVCIVTTETGVESPLPLPPTHRVTACHIYITTLPVYSILGVRRGTWRCVIYNRYHIGHYVQRRVTSFDTITYYVGKNDVILSYDQSRHIYYLQCFIDDTRLYVTASQYDGHTQNTLHLKHNTCILSFHPPSHPEQWAAWIISASACNI